ncbi:MAG TPA: glycosyl transferase [Candidatus Eisenbacteria bacterium]|jgi:glucosyl-3-phosphoglycerate synthase|nr:glycosyl transferase [Candidatus Eisenbacteria bacterium]
MSDFYQNGVIATLHKLGRQDPEALERRLTLHAQSVAGALVLPCLYSEIEGPAMGNIVEQLSHVRYLEEIVVALGTADRRQFENARRFFAPLGERCRILWIEGPRVTEFIRLLGENDLAIGPPGKGRATWLSLGYVLGGQCRVIALHDCDIVTYDRSLLARLIYPLMDEALGYEYGKGYYSRVSDRLNGRVTRLFLTPLVHTLTQLLGPTPFLRYIDSFRYPLAGEFAMTVDLARSVHIPGDWGLEVGMLAEVYRNTSTRRVCQVDIAENYDHKHQPLSGEDASAGLHRMTRDIAKTLLRTIAGEGVLLPAGFYPSLKVAYLRQAQDAVRVYHDDAVLNGLLFDRHAESSAVEVFTRALSRACEEFEADPMAFTGLPNWNRVDSAIPDFLERFRDAVDADSR